MEPGLGRLRNAFRAEWGAAGEGELAHSFEHLVRRSEELLVGEDLRGRSVLEVGAGRGFFACYAAVCRGASSVTALDEYGGHGAPETSYETALRLRSHLGEEARIRVEKSDFLEWEPDRRFDYVILVNVLHHIVETRERLSRDPQRWELALRTFARVRQALAPGGRLLVQELSCRNCCPLPRYRRRMRGVRWSNKQAPGEWCRALRAAGFPAPRVRYRYPLNLTELPALRPLLASRFVSLLTDSSYVICAAAGPE